VRRLGSIWISAPVLALATACSVLNSPHERLPARGACDGGACSASSDPCEAGCDRSASCEQPDGGHARCICPAGLLDVEGDGSDCRPIAACSDRECGPGEVCGRVGDTIACVCAQGHERAGADGELVGNGQLTLREIEIAGDADAVVAGEVTGASTIAGESVRVVTTFYAYVARLDRAGNTLWGHVFPAGHVWDLAASPGGKIYLAAGYSPPADFGGGIVGERGRTFILGLRP